MNELWFKVRCSGKNRIKIWNKNKSTIKKRILIKWWSLHTDYIIRPAMEKSSNVFRLTFWWIIKCYKNHDSINKLLKLGVSWQNTVSHQCINDKIKIFIFVFTTNFRNSIDLISFCFSRFQLLSAEWNVLTSWNWLNEGMLSCWHDFI